MHRERETISLTRDVEVVEIPAGTTKMLAWGTEVVVIQSLGGSYTIQAADGGLYRIDERNVDAIGKAPSSGADKAGLPQADLSLEDQVWQQLKTCYDPEIPIDIVNLGLIYHCDVTPLESQPGAFRVDIEMTLTAPGCGMGGVLKADVERKVMTLATVKEVNVELIFEPQWEQSMMSEAAKLQLGMY